MTEPWSNKPAAGSAWPTLKLAIERHWPDVAKPGPLEYTNMQLKHIVLATILVAALLCSCERGRRYSASAVFNERAKLAEVTENFVRVVVSLEADSAGQPVIRATFTPTERGLHLYSKDMPEEGVKGYGRPTRLDLVGGAVKAAGPVFCDVSPHVLDLSGVKLPIYPEGPVTLRQPVEISGGGDLTAQIEISFMACRTSGECKFPVQRKRVELKLPKG